MEENSIRNRIKKLKEMFPLYKIDGYFIPNNNPRFSFSSKQNHLKYISGFTGSYGVIFITLDEFIFITDGRYIEQAKQEVKDIDNLIILENTKIKLINEKVKNKIIGFNPSLSTVNIFTQYNKTKFLPVKQNLISFLQPNNVTKITYSKIFEYKIEYSGMHCSNKLSICYKHMDDNNAEYLLITDPESINWLLNIRARDLEFTPILLCYLLISRKKIYLFCHDAKNRINNLQHSEWNFVIEPVEIRKIETTLHTTVKEKIILDYDTCPLSLINVLDKAQVINIQNILAFHKSYKNQTEIQLSVKEHINDAISLCELFACITEINRKDQLTEFQLTELIKQHRKKNPNYICESFPTICGYAENSAIIHYTPKKNNSKLISHVDSQIILVDSGAQYFGCTTDVTRTLLTNINAISKNKLNEISYFYTLVLKGHIAIANAKFIIGTTGNYLDSLAKQFLYNAGITYPHGTGHGVGSCLNVHEGPYSISQHNNLALQEGIILSNEPGCYFSELYGIRIENLCYVMKSELDNFLELKQLTLIPYCSDLIMWNLISTEEMYYLKKYYTQIKQFILPNLSKKAYNWCFKEINSLFNLNQKRPRSALF